MHFGGNRRRNIILAILLIASLFSFLLQTPDPLIFSSILIILIMGLKKGLEWISNSIKLLRLYPQLFKPYAIVFMIFVVMIMIFLISLIEGWFLRAMDVFASIVFTRRFMVGLLPIFVLVLPISMFFLIVVTLQIVIHFGLVLLASMTEDIVEYGRKPSLKRGLRSYVANFFEILKCEIVSAVAWLITITILAVLERISKKISPHLLRLLEVLVGVGHVITQTIISFTIVSIVLEEKRFKDAFKSAVEFTKKELPVLAVVQLIGVLIAVLFAGYLGFIVLVLPNIAPYSSIGYFITYLEEFLFSKGMGKPEASVVIMSIILFPAFLIILFLGFLTLTISDLSLILGYYEKMGYRKKINELIKK